MFRYFYCLDLWQSFLIMLIFTILLKWLFKKYEDNKYIIATYGLLFVLSIILVIFYTLVSRKSLNYHAFNFIPFSSYIKVLNGADTEFIRSNYMNVLLLFPSGLLSGLLYKKKYPKVIILLFFCTLSIFIECTQYKFGLGYAEVDDIIHNTAGAAIGIWVSAFDLSRVDIKNLLRRKYK